MRHIFSFHHDVLGVICNKYTHSEGCTITKKIWTVIGICDYESVQVLFTSELQVGTELSQYWNVCNWVFKALYLMGAYRKLYFWKRVHWKCSHSCSWHQHHVHSNHNVVVVGPSWVACYGKFEVFPLIEFSSVGLSMINHFKHIYPWRLSGLSDSIFINVGVIIILGGLNKVGSLGGSLLPLAHFVEMSNFMTVFALGIFGRTPLPPLVFLFSTSHALVLHPWGFSRLMTRIRRSCAPD